MHYTQNTQWGNVAVVGLGKSGLAACLYILARPERFTSLTIIDSAAAPRAAEQVTHAAKGHAVTYLFGIESYVDQGFAPFDTCIMSPGIKPSTPLYRSLVAPGVAREVISEIEFAWRERPSTWIAITGTNGKTTTTALTTHLLRAGGLDAVSVGNIGSPAIEAVGESENRPDVIFVAETSSFQLHETHQFHPRVAALLNITPDHIDWHGSLEAYGADKTRVYAHCGAHDLIELNAADPLVAAGKPEAMATGATVEMIESSVDDLARWVSPDEMSIKGPHNIANALFAAHAASFMGVDDSAIEAGLKSFAPVPHRLELISTQDGFHWYNDSKATNPDAVLKALSAFTSEPLYLLVGGRNKGNRFIELARAAFAKDNLEAVYCFGETGPLLHDDFSTVAQEENLQDARIIQVATLKEAVESARSTAPQGAVILLSPACASFDEFMSFEDRGEKFVSYVIGPLGCPLKK